MLSESARPLIEATAPVIAEHLPDIAPKFYKSMFEAEPQLIEEGIFSRANQRTGEQPLALAGSVVAFATHILNHPESYPDELLSRVANKHTSLGIVEGQYPIVEKHLLGAIADDLGDALTPEIAAAWTEVYWLMADALIKLEKGLYSEQANDNVFNEFTLVDKRETSEGTYVLTYEPADDTPMTDAVAGQYVSIKVRLPEGIEQSRQFTLIPVDSPRQRRLAVKQDMDGEVSPVVTAMEVGSTVKLSNPYGDVVLTGSTAPLVLISSGIGVTPMVAFLDRLVAEGSQRQVTAFRVDSSDAAAPLLEEQKALIEKLPEARFERWTVEEGEADHIGRADFGAQGVDAGAEVYLCGSLDFMKETRSALIGAGIPGKQIRYEIFGPDLWMLHDDAVEYHADAE